MKVREVMMEGEGVKVREKVMMEGEGGKGREETQRNPDKNTAASMTS